MLFVPCCLVFFFLLTFLSLLFFLFPFSQWVFFLFSGKDGFLLCCSPDPRCLTDSCYSWALSSPLFERTLSEVYLILLNEKWQQC